MASKLIHKLTSKKKKEEVEPEHSVSSAAAAAPSHATPPASPAPVAKETPSNVQGVLTLVVVEGRNLNQGQSDIAPLCVVEFDQHQINTPAGQGCHPKWSTEMKFDVTNHVDATVWVYAGSGKDASDGSDDICIGSCAIVPMYNSAAVKEAWYPLKKVLPSDPQPTGEILIRAKFQSTKARKLNMEDFTVLKVIGKGSFGKVMMVRKNDTGAIYAIKILKKEYLSERGEIEHTVSERKILAANTNPFLVSLKYSFQTVDKIYFVLDYISGGELFVHLQREGCFSEERARLYAAQLILAIEHLHVHNIVYRDLKPENILIDMNGYIKLTDFGLCKQNVTKESKTGTFCGTPEYMAPEILQQKGYGMEVDWWTIGTLLFEMLTGLPPFYDENTQEMYQKILYEPLIFPPEVSPHARSLISGMLQRDPAKRLGRGGATEIKSHAFFKGLNWQDLFDKKIKPPWKPSLKSALDTSYFDPEFTRLPARDTPSSRPTNLRASLQDKFVGFTYVADN